MTAENNIVDLFHTTLPEKVSDGFLGTIQEIMNSSYLALKQYLRNEYFEDYNNKIPCIDIVLSAENEGPAIVSKQYQNNRYCRLFRFETRITGFGLKQDSVDWS